MTNTKYMNTIYANIKQKQLMTNTKYAMNTILNTCNPYIKQKQLMTNTKYMNTIYANIKTKTADDKY